MTGKMKAQVFYEPEVMKLEEVDIPQINDSQVLVKVKACAICGSDLSYYFGHSPLGTPNGKGPLILGHEFSGVVAEVGAKAADMGLYKLSDRVIGNPVGPCFACSACQKGNTNVCSHVSTNGVNVNGAYAEYVVLPYTNLVPMPDDMSFEYGALTEPTACSMYAIDQLAPDMGDLVVIYGPGPIGLTMAQLAKAKGAGKVVMVGRRDYPLEVAKAVGADYVLNVKDKSSPYYCDDVTAFVKSVNAGARAPRAIVPTSSLDAMHSAMDVTGERATIVMFGLPSPEDRLQIPVLDFIYNDKIVKFSWLAPRVWPETVNAIGTGKVDLSRIITNRFTLDDAKKGIRYMKQSPDNKIKGIVLI